MTRSFTRHRTFLTAPEQYIPGEVNTLKTETEPNQVKTLQEIVDAYAQGLPIRGNNLGEPQYYPEELGYIPDPRELDLSEIDDMRRSLQRDIERLNQEEQQRQQELSNPTPPKPQSAATTSEPTGLDMPPESGGNHEPKAN